MLPRRILAKQTKWLWIGFIALGPLAYLAGIWLTLKYDPHVRVGLSVDRAAAIAAAARYATAQGVNVTGWDSFCRFKYDNDLMFFYRERAEAEAARRIAPEAIVGVLFRAPDRSETLEVELSREGMPLGFSRKVSRANETNDPGEAAARKIAEEALRVRLAAAGVEAAPELRLSEGANREDATRTYTGRWPLATLPELKVENTFTVRGGTLIRDNIEADLEKNPITRQSPISRFLKIASLCLYVLLVMVTVIYGLYRFVWRARSREVSYSRATIIGAIFAAVMAAFVLILDTALYETNRNTPGFPVPDWMILFSGSMFYAVIGLFMGLAYGSGEGDFREAYPGKLAALDALVVGKVFSSNVGRAVVIGCAIGGWALLGTHLAFLFWQGRPGAGEGLNELANAWIGRAPWLAPFLAWPMDVILVTVIGLLIPLPFLHRRRRLRRFAIPILFVLAWIACAAPYQDFRPWYGVALMAAIRAALLLLAFLAFDLLTAIVALAFPTFVSFAVVLAAQPAPSLSRAGQTSLALALIALAIGVFFAFKGRRYREEEVRPIYAKHLAERLSMQAEVSAAREAQLRLMSNNLPSSSHFSVAASCLPAFVVGGDFYDVYELEPGKLGVLIAEGGGRGLGSALSIAYAKGFLMPKILGDTRADDSPVEIIRGLQEKLNSLLADEANLGIAYAVIDAADGQLRYARTGPHPSVLVGRKDTAAGLLKPEESVLKFESGSGADGDLAVIAGAHSLEDGDSVVFFTDGIAKDWTENRSSPEKEFAKVLRVSSGKVSGELQQELTKSVGECARHARKHGLEDDLTAVIIRLEKTADAAQ